MLTIFIINTIKSFMSAKCGPVAFAYNRVGNFLLLVWDRRNVIFYGDGECEVKGAECVMAAECE